MGSDSPVIFRFLNTRAGGGSDADRGDTAFIPARYWGRTPHGGIETSTHVQLKADGPWYGVSTHQAHLVLVSPDGSYLPIPDHVEAVVEPRDHEVHTPADPT